MENSDSYSVGSFRQNSLSVWRNTGMKVFSRSSTRNNENDDEESLKWAALEKLPTYNRLRTGLWTASHGRITEVKTDDLGFDKKRDLIERLVRIPEHDNEKFLLKIKSRIDRVGIETPKIEVRYEHLSVAGEAYEGSRALPSLINFFSNILEGILGSLRVFPSRKRRFKILHDVSGIIKPKRMTLLLGPPSSGKTTLLLALAGKLDKELEVSGRVSYNGHEMNEFVPQRTAAYISQYDDHIGEMTVRETLAFSARCQGVGSRYEMMAELSRREKEAKIKPDPDIDIYMKAAATEGHEANVVIDYILRILGLEVCADTMVGDEMLRGISGGQRKRVTTGEMLVGPTKVLFMDEISNGLDSSTTYQIVNSLRQYVHILEGTAFISLLQPAPETYNLFDDIVLLSDGKIVYHGPREHVLTFFESLGFKCPGRKGVADFLQEVTSYKDQKQYWARRDDEPYRFFSATDFVEAFQSFHVGQSLGDEIAIPFDKKRSHPAALTTNKYGVNTKELLKVCASRELLLMKRNSFAYIFKICQMLIVSIVTMTVYLRTDMDKETETGGIVYTSSLFFILAMLMFNGAAELVMTVAKLPVFYKQRDFLFYPAWAYSLPSWILKIPISFIEAGVFSIAYYVIGYDPNIARFFKQYLILVLVNQIASGVYRLTGALGRNMIVASTCGAFAFLVLFVLGGFVLARQDVKKWWLWGYWCSPLMYGQNALAANEFLGHSWNKFIGNSSESLGVIVMKSRGMFPHSYWYWIGAGALVGFTTLFNFLYTMALAYLDPFGKDQAFKPEDPQSDQVIKMTESHKSSKDHISNEGSYNKRKGMVLPFEPHSLTFDEIRYSVDMPPEMRDQGATEEKLVLLNGVSGTFRPGVLTALMGVSGAGKTTLMDVLAGRKTGGYVDGNITISGYPKKQETFTRISGYCEQNDIHTPHLTVHESLVYSAWLRSPPEVNSETRMMFVKEVMGLVELDSLKSALVGLPGVNGLSTEQRKRLTIAVELVANPSIIFMDEPTSGLDARAAAIVMRTVRNTVDTGRTVVCTIHQPSIDIFEAFDELFLLKRGGQEIYVGPLGRHSCHLINYFESLDGVSKIKEGYNPATWMLEVTATTQEALMSVDFTDVYRNSELYRRNKALIEELSSPVPSSKDLYYKSQFAQSFHVQCLACLWKMQRAYWRNTPYTAVRFLFTIVIALTFGTIFWDLGGKMKKRQELFNAMGSMYAAVAFIGVQNATTVQPVVAVERTVFYREKAAGMYSAFPYAFAQVLIEIPYVLLQAVIYGIIVYAMIGFEWTAAKFFWYIFFTYTSFLYHTYYGMMTVAVTPNQQLAAIIASSFYGMWNLFSGFIIPRSRIPPWWIWYYWACPMAWTLYGMLVTQFGDRNDELDTGETVKTFLSSYFGYERDFVGTVVAVVVGFVVIFAFTFAFSIKAFKFQRR